MHRSSFICDASRVIPADCTIQHCQPCENEIQAGPTGGEGRSVIRGVIADRAVEDFRARPPRHATIQLNATAAEAGEIPVDSAPHNLELFGFRGLIVDAAALCSIALTDVIDDR